MTDPFQKPKDAPVLPSSHSYPYAGKFGVGSSQLPKIVQDIKMPPFGDKAAMAEITRLRARVAELENLLRIISDEKDDGELNTVEMLCAEIVAVRHLAIRALKGPAHDAKG